MTAARIGLILGPLLAAAMLALAAPEGLSATAWQVAALAVLMAVWWATEALPLPVTALLPLLVAPLTGLASLETVGASFGDPIVFLMLGGFALGVAIERWNLHRRVALAVLVRIGSAPDRLVLGFALATAAVSMWISNTATALMMMPIAVSVGLALEPDRSIDRPITRAIALAVAYAASIGGLATPIGSPTNLLVMAFLERQGISFSFLAWMAMGVPIMLAMLVALHLVLTRARGRLPATDTGAARLAIDGLAAQVGPISSAEWRLMIVFGTVATLWIVRQWLELWPPLAGLTDPMIALGGALALFLLPAGRVAPGRALLTWPEAETLPWGILLLFGGGLALAALITESGLAAWVGAGLTGLSVLPVILLVACLVALLVFLTEFTSNMAAVAAFLPLVIPVAEVAGLDALLLAVPVGLAASCGFMLPAGTAPNAIAFATGAIRLPQMLAYGWRLNLAAVVIISLAAALILPRL